MREEEMVSRRRCSVMKQEHISDYSDTVCRWAKWPQPGLAIIVALLLLTGCGEREQLPIAIAITTPATGTPVSGTVPVQMTATDDRQLTSIDLYVREKGSQGDGTFVGTATSQPFVVQWFTPAQPNQADLELVAIGSDAQGRRGTSLPVAVRTQNTGVPALQALLAFTIEPSPALAQSSVTPLSFLPNDLATITLPADTSQVDLKHVPETSQAVHATSSSRNYILEWQWDSFPNADGYGIYLGKTDLAGPYEVQVRQAAAAATGVQKHSRVITDGAAGQRYWGTVTAISAGATVESGLSNADRTAFLPPHQAIAPLTGMSVPGGRPRLEWEPAAGAIGYVFYLYDKNPWAADKTLLWSNFPQSTAALAAEYPADRPDLASGSYWWWVAAVSFGSDGKPEAFSFSNAQSFSVP
jgi:hypothetical protein